MTWATSLDPWSQWPARGGSSPPGSAQAKPLVWRGSLRDGRLRAARRQSGQAALPASSRRPVRRGGTRVSAPPHRCVPCPPTRSRRSRRWCSQGRVWGRMSAALVTTSTPFAVGPHPRCAQRLHAHASRSSPGGVHTAPATPLGRRRYGAQHAGGTPCAAPSPPPPGIPGPCAALHGRLAVPGHAPRVTPLTRTRLRLVISSQYGGV